MTTAKTKKPRKTLTIEELQADLAMKKNTYSANYENTSDCWW